MAPTREFFWLEAPSLWTVIDCENRWIVCSYRNMLFRHRTVCNSNMLCYLPIVQRNVWRVRQLPKMSTKFHGIQNSEKEPTSAIYLFSMLKVSIKTQRKRAVSKRSFNLQWDDCLQIYSSSLTGSFLTESANKYIIQTLWKSPQNIVVSFISWRALLWWHNRLGLFISISCCADGWVEPRPAEMQSQE